MDALGNPKNFESVRGPLVRGVRLQSDYGGNAANRLRQGYGGPPKRDGCAVAREGGSRIPRTSGIVE